MSELKSTPHTKEIAYILFLAELKINERMSNIETYFDAMNYILCMNGVCYKWDEGIVVDMEKKLQIYDLIEPLDLKYQRDRLYEDMTSTHMGTDNLDLYIYPLNEYSLLCNLPSTMEKSWYDAIKLFFDELYENIHMLNEKTIKLLNKSHSKFRKITILV